MSRAGGARAGATDTPQAPAWVDAPPGPFAHWSGVEPEVLGTDPYLLWADATAFVHAGRRCDTRHRRQSQVPDDIPVLIELAPDWTVARLRRAAGSMIRIPRVFAGADRFLTARIDRRFIPAVDTGVLKGAVLRVELGMPNRPERARHLAGHGLPPQSTTGVLLGVIDNGCAFAHAALRRGPGQTRVLAIWDQESCRDDMAFGAAPAPGATPRGFGYGRQVLRHELEALIATTSIGGVLNEDACYEAANYRPLRSRVTHGAHVLDTFAGSVAPGRRTWERVKGAFPTDPDFQPSTAGAAVESDIVFVQFPRDALGDTTGGWLCVQVLDAVRYILSCKGEATERVVINLSYGSQVGPHDGTSTLERALAVLCQENPCLDIVLPVGNSFNRRAHAGGGVPKLTARAVVRDRLPQVRWSVPVECEEPTYVELWMPEGAKTGVKLSLPLPAGSGSPVVMPGQCKVWPDATNPLVGIFHLARPACGQNGSMVLIALAPTTTLRSGVGVAPAGYWALELACGDDARPPVDAYIARNDPDIGQPLRGRTASFVQSDYDPEKPLRAADDDDLRAEMPCVVQRRGTMNWTFRAIPVAHLADSTGKVHVVAGRVLNTQFPNGARKQYHPPYSSAGPDRSGAVQAPEGSCVTDESVVLRGIRAAGTRSGSHVRLIGTSTAAPQLARLLANGAALAHAPVSPAPWPSTDVPLEGTILFGPPGS